MRICPKCQAYYADESTEFCLADGTPVVNVDPGSDKWNEGARFIKEKERARKKQKRLVKWRWLVMSAITALVLTMIVAKSFTLETIPPSPPLPTPSASPSTAMSTSPSSSTTPIPTATIVVRETPTPTIVRKETPTPTIVIQKTPTPRIEKDPTPTIVIKRTPTPTIVIKETPTPTQNPTARVCSDADERRDDQIIRGYFPNWRRSIQAERAKIIAENTPDGAKSAEAILGEIEFQTALLIPCKSATVAARYAWQVSYSQNGTPSRTKTVSRKRTIGCGKVFGIWVCH